MVVKLIISLQITNNVNDINNHELWSTLPIR